MEKTQQIECIVDLEQINQTDLNDIKPAFDLDEISQIVSLRFDDSQALKYLSSIAFQLYQSCPDRYNESKIMESDLHAIADMTPDFDFLKWFDKKVAGRLNNESMNPLLLRRKTQKYRLLSSPQNYRAAVLIATSRKVKRLPHDCCAIGRGYAGPCPIRVEVAKKIFADIHGVEY